MLGSTVAIVVESKDPKFPVGSRIVTNSGWVKKGKRNTSEMINEGPGSK